MKVSTKFSNSVRALLALAGALLVILSFLSRGGVITGYNVLNSLIVVVAGIALFALGLYSPKTGFRGLGRGSWSGTDESPGASTGKYSKHSGDGDGFGGGDG